MNKKAIFLLLNVVFLCLVATGQKKKNHKHLRIFHKTYYVLVSTEYGDIKIKLYNETPQHRDNFIELVEKGYYDSTLFHRVINKFMIQGGDPDSKNAKAGVQLGNGGPGYTIPAEFNHNLIHKKGVLAAAREGDQVNPQKASSGSQFYIVQGKVWTKKEIDAMLKQKNARLFKRALMEFFSNAENSAYRKRYDSLLKSKDEEGIKVLFEEVTPIIKTELKDSGKWYSYTPEQYKVYETIGGTPHLDMDYTVFGEVVEGIEVVDTIAKLPTDKNNRPLHDVKMSIKIVKK